MTIDPVVPVSKSAFLAVLAEAKKSSDKINDATSPVHEVADATTDDDGFYLDLNGRYGFIVKQDGELIALFSMVRRSGDELVQQAIELGANRLDCFDGYLTGFYERNGFMEVDRLANWTPGQPDVVFMQLNAACILR